MTDVVMAYDRTSRLAGPVLMLGTSNVEGVDGPFFAGWATRPRIVAQLLLTVAAVARASYFRPLSARSLDPILTAGDGRLRIESFSGCCGVYARADLLPDGLGDVAVGAGTTNVDLNQAVRDALSRVDDDGELQLSIGQEGLRVRTRDATAFERKVRLPTRWVKGLGEAALAQLGLEAVATLDQVASRRVLAELPPAGRASAMPYRLAPREWGLRWQQTAEPSAAVVAGPYRLRELVPLSPYLTSLTVWCRPGGERGPVAFQIELPGARMWLVLSPDVARGFSGEGAALEAMNDPMAIDAAGQLRPTLDWSARLNETALAERIGASPARVRTLLAVLGGQGVVGRDLAAQAWFRRDLPFVPDRVAKLQPRLRNADRISNDDLTARPVEGGHEVFVRSGQISHRVVLQGEVARCTCRWSIRYGSSRGPCRHILAARRLVGTQEST